MGHPRFIPLADGSIQFIKRGDPPEIVPGYEVDTGDPFIFHPIMPPCQYRTFKLVVLNCCPEGKNVRHCTKYNFHAMLPALCQNCVKAGGDK